MAFDVRNWFVQASLLYGGNGNDHLVASGYATVMAGLGGNDTLQADAAGSIFDLGYWGGRGDDMLIGSYARDAYLYMPGDGNDTIRDDVRAFSQGPADYFYAHSNDLNYHDYLLFGPGISSRDVTPVREGADLVFQVRGGGSVRVQDWFATSVFTQIEYVSFMDGTVWTSGSLMHALDPSHVGVQLAAPGDLQGSPYADSLTAGNYGATLWGGDGKDELGWKVDPGVFAVQYHGGAGDDMIVGTYGGDTYYFDRGDGKDVIVDDVRNLDNEGVNEFFLANSSFPSYQDTLVFGAGISVADVTPTRSGNDLVLQVGAAGSGDSITVRNFFDGTIFAQIESFRFADGTVRTMSDIIATVAPQYPGVNVRGSGLVTGTPLADTLTAMSWGTELRGGAGNDTLGAIANGAVFGVTFNGGQGDDVITGTYGGDTYVYAPGDGADVITDSVRNLGTAGVTEYFLAHPDDPSYQDRLMIQADRGALRDAYRADNDLVLEFTTAGDRITIKDWYDGTGLNRIELIGFADGSELVVHT